MSVPTLTTALEPQTNRMILLTDGIFDGSSTAQVKSFCRRQGWRKRQRRSPAENVPSQLSIDHGIGVGVEDTCDPVLAITSNVVGVDINQDILTNLIAVESVLTSQQFDHEHYIPFNSYCKSTPWTPMRMELPATERLSFQTVPRPTCLSITSADLPSKMKCSYQVSFGSKQKLFLKDSLCSLSEPSDVLMQDAMESSICLEECPYDSTAIQSSKKILESHHESLPMTSSQRS